MRVHTLPTRPKDIEDDGAFHYAVLGLQRRLGVRQAERRGQAISGRDHRAGQAPRVPERRPAARFRLRTAWNWPLARVRDYLAWEIVREEIKKQQKDGNVDPARAQTLQINIDKAKGRIPEAIKQAYCIVVTVSEKDEVQAFKITVNDEPHFNIIKGDKRSRVQDTAITAEALLPGRTIQPLAARRDVSTRQGPGGSVCPASASAEDAQGQRHPRHAGRWVREGHLCPAARPAGRNIPHLVDVAAG